MGVGAACDHAGMPSYVALLRAVNVGGRFVKMAQLRAALSGKGFGEVQSHIQSGNLLVTTPMCSPGKVELALEAALQEAAGFTVATMVRTPQQLRALTTELDGIPALLPEPGRRYVSFAKGPISGEAAQRVDGWDEPGERAAVLGSHVLVELGKVTHLAKLGNSRLERITGQPMTARDAKVVRALSEKWGEP